jgi:drug/metabolite transporter (DMT)-like permease
VILLFSETASNALHSSGLSASVIGLIILVIGTIGWAGGSLYSKHKLSGSFTVTAAWQMLAAGVAFLISSFLNKEWIGFDWTSIPIKSWLAVLYLVTMGSLAGFSAFCGSCR